MEGFPFGPFLLAVGLGLSGSISWTVQACDLSRVLPARSSPAGVFAWVFIGMTVPLLVLGGIGAWVSTDAALDNPMVRVDQLLGGGIVATVALVALGTSLATANAFNDFSAGLSLKQMGLRFPRIVCSLFVTTAGVTLALISRNTQLGQLTSDIVLFAGYYTAPWFGVVIVEDVDIDWIHIWISCARILHYITPLCHFISLLMYATLRGIQSKKKASSVLVHADGVLGLVGEGGLMGKGNQELVEERLKDGGKE